MARRLVVPLWRRIQPTIWFISSDTKNMRSASPRWAIENTDTRGRPVGVVEQRLRIERIPLEPDFEAGRREHAIELHRQREALLGRKERLEIDDADLVERRRLHFADERREIEAGAALPGVGQKGGDEAVFAAARRRVDTGQHERARRGAAGALRQQLRIVTFGGRRRGEGAEDRDRPPCPAARACRS